MDGDRITIVGNDGIHSSSTRNAIPLDRRPAIVACALERLQDKTSIVRKEAVRFFTKCIETHPFWLDGGVVSAEGFMKRLEEVDRKLAEVSVSCIVVCVLY